MIAHVFVDAENIPPSVTFKVVEHFGKEHTITKVDIIAKEDTLPYKYRNLDEKIYRVQNCFYGKNSADTWLCFEMVRAIIDEPDLELIIIVSSDKDFLPAIKFAVDFDKKILIVSNGAGHKTLIEQLKILNVNPDAVELKDFRLKFGDVPSKLERFLPLLSFGIKKYLFDREDRIKFILVKKGGQIFEVPFVAGMTINIFGRLLRELNILNYGDSLRSFISKNFLRLTRSNRIYFCSEAELSAPTHAEQIEKFFSEHAEETIKIFIKHNSKLSEIPFVNGMPLTLFGRFLREKKIIGRNSSTIKIAAQSLLDVRDGKVYLIAEDELEAAQDDLEIDLEGYFAEHTAEIRTISIVHDGNIFSIPFVDGILIKMFGKLLRERKIIDRKILPEEVIADNELVLRGEKVFINKEASE